MFKKILKQLLEMENVINDIKNSMKEFNSRLQIAKNVWSGKQFRRNHPNITKKGKKNGNK